MIIFLIFLFFKSCIFSKSSKNTFYKKLFTKKYIYKYYILNYWVLKKIMYTYLFKNYLQKSVNHRLSGNPFSWANINGWWRHHHFWKNIKNEGLASVKKWKFSFRKTEIIQMSSFSLVYTPKNQYDLQSYSYCPFSIAKLMWCWLWWFVGSLLKTCHCSVWGGGSG